MNFYIGAKFMHFTFYIITLSFLQAALDIHGEIKMHKSWHIWKVLLVRAFQNGDIIAFQSYISIIYLVCPFDVLCDLYCVRFESTLVIQYANSFINEAYINSIDPRILCKYLRRWDIKLMFCKVTNFSFFPWGPFWQ